MKKVICLLSLLMIFTSYIHAQEDIDFPAPSAAEVPGAKILQQKYFDGNALWGHIDGGADLYLEYGFDKLLFQEIEWNATKLRVEFYRMKDPGAAFGIFSVSRFKCNIKDSITLFSCITPYQVQSAIGRFYISIANDKGTNEAQNLSLNLFHLIVDKTNENLFELPDQFKNPVYDKYSDGIKLFRGTLGLQNGLPSWIDLFDKYTGYEIIVLPVEESNGYLYISTIKFKTEKDKSGFISSIGVNIEHGKKRYEIQNENKKFIVKLISEKEIQFFETDFSSDKLKDYQLE